MYNIASIEIPVLKVRGKLMTNNPHIELLKEKSDLYLLTMDMLAEKITFEEWLRKSVLWAKDVTYIDMQENEERKREVP